MYHAYKLSFRAISSQLSVSGRELKVALGFPPLRGDEADCVKVALGFPPLRGDEADCAEDVTVQSKQQEIRSKDSTCMATFHLHIGFHRHISYELKQKMGVDDKMFISFKDKVIAK